MNDNKNNEAASSGWGKATRRYNSGPIYISLIEQIQFSSVISKSYTQLPAEEQFLRNENIAKTRFRYHDYLGSGTQSERFGRALIQ